MSDIYLWHKTKSNTETNKLNWNPTMETKLNLKKEKETKIENTKLWSLWQQIQHENERKISKDGRSIILIWKTKHSSEYDSYPRLNHLKRSWFRQDSKAGLQVKDQLIYLQWKHSNSKRSNSCDSPSLRKMSNSLSITPNKDNSPLCVREFSRQTRTQWQAGESLSLTGKWKHSLARS